MNAVHHRSCSLATLGLLATLTLAGGCDDSRFDPLSGQAPEFEPDRPTLREAATASPYTGTDPIVNEAQERLVTGLDLHAKVIVRTCGPTSGVCHNTKEYPDLHTPANFLGAVGAPCNVQPVDHEAVFDRCELSGDRFELNAENGEVEVGHIAYIPGDYDPDEDGDAQAQTPGLHLYFAEPVDVGANSRWHQARFIRAFVNEEQRVQDLSFATYNSQWWTIEEQGRPSGTHLMARIRPYQISQVQDLLEVGIREGDRNRNGVFGARVTAVEGGGRVPMLNPGRPEESYLVARLRGEMQGVEVPGTRMPLANQPLSAAEFLALYCFIYGLETQGGTANLADAIDYENCPYSESPENLDLLGSSGGISWRGRIQRILEFNCGGCHAGNQAQAGLDLKDGDVYARLMQPSGQQPELKLIEAGVPAESYLWLKLTGDPSIDGFAMPFNPLTGAGRLRDDELSDIRAWIQAGAPMDDASADAPTQNSPASSTSSSPDAGPPLGDGGP